MSNTRFSESPPASPLTTEVLRLKRKLAATHRELDEARVSGRKRIL